MPLNSLEVTNLTSKSIPGCGCRDHYKDYGWLPLQGRPSVIDLNN